MVDETAWYVRYGIKVAGTVTALRVFAAISVSPGCIIAGLILILIGIIVVILEVPFCCAMIPQLHKFNEFTEKRSPIQRAIFYGIAAILPVGMCFGVSTIICGLALAGLCVFNVWRFIQNRRSGQTGMETGGYTVPTGQPSVPQAGMPQTYNEAPGFRDQLVEKAAVGAVKGVMSGGYPGTGNAGVGGPGSGYSGF